MVHIQVHWMTYKASQHSLISKLLIDAHWRGVFYIGTKVGLIKQFTKELVLSSYQRK